LDLLLLGVSNRNLSKEEIEKERERLEELYLHTKEREEE